MADTINPQITDAVTDQVTATNVNVLAQAPAMAMGSLYQTLGSSAATAAAAAVSAQQDPLHPPPDLC